MSENNSQSISKTFSASYGRLKEIADSMRNQEDPNIDNLIPLAEEGVNCYSICKERIASVKLAFADIMAKSDIPID